MFCKNCGKELPSGSKFCLYCGSQVDTTLHRTDAFSETALIAEKDRPNTAQPILAISCSTPGCRNPVIGQCSGYKGSCGRYYCAEHSSGKLCDECAGQKLRDELAERIFQENLLASEKLRKEMRRISWLGALLGMAGGILFAFLAASADAPLAGAVGFYISPIIGLVIAGMKRNELKKERMKQLAPTHPGFAEFYEVWKKEKNKDSRRKGFAVAGTLGAIALGAAAVAGQAARENELRDDIRSIRNSLEK